MATGAKTERETLRTLPGDDVRQIMWRFADRFDLQMVVQSSRAVARGPVARLVAEGGRNSHDWTPGKAGLLQAFDESGISSVFMEPEEGGFIAGPKNLVLALVAFELAWVDAGAATGSLATCLGLSPIHERGTEEQRREYMSRCIPPQPGEDRQMLRAAFALTEPIPYVGVETGLLGGKVRVAEWKEGEEPILQVDKRGRFITNMGFANLVTAAVDSADPRIKGTCMVILEETDPGIVRPRHAHAQNGPSALLHHRPDLQPARPGQPHHWRVHGQGRRHHPALVQARRNHRGRVPAHARDGRPDDIPPSCSPRSSP